MPNEQTTRARADAPDGAAGPLLEPEREQPAIASAAPVLQRARPAAPADGAPPVLSRPAAPAPAASRGELPEASRAAALCARLSALGEALAAGGALDRPAIDAVLAEADASLRELKALAAALPREARAEVAAVRAELLDQAFSLTTAVQRLIASEVPSPAAGTPAPAVPALGRVTEFQPHAAPEQRRGRGAVIGFVLAVILAAGYHGHEYWAQQQRAPLGADLPEGYTASAPPESELRTLIAGPGADLARFEKYRAEQVARGKTVQELGPGVWMVLSPPNGRRAAAPGGGGP